MNTDYWKGLLFAGGYLSLASVLAEAAREATPIALASEQDEDVHPTTAPQPQALKCA